MARQHERAAPPAPRRSAPRRWTWAPVLAAAALLAAVIAYVPAARTVARDPTLSVLLISIDTLRADALGSYGRKDAGTPWMDRLAREGVRFDDAHAHNVVTLPSHANMLSGRHPFEHGIRDNSGFRFPAGTPTLATILKSRGYRTGAFVSAFPLDSRFGLAAGFDVYDDRLGGAETHSAFLVAERPASETVAAAVRWLEGGSGERRFTFVHLYEPHYAYAPPPPFAERFQSDPYQGEVAAADAALEPLLRPLLDAGQRGGALVILTSDHGEALGEHGESTHGVFAYEGVLRVPLILYAPRLLRPAVLREPAAHVDILPTVLDALAIEPPAGLPGRSLLPSVTARSEAARLTYFEALSTSLNRGWAPLHGVLQDGLKYIDLPIPELYDVVNDPGETRNLAATRPEELARLRASLQELRARDAGGARRSREDPGVTERLRSLGYVSGHAAAKRHHGEDDDPKRLIALDAALADSLRAFAEADHARAVALCRETIARRPDMPLAYGQLAYLERARGDLPAAVSAARKAYELRPDDGESAAALATYLVESGRAAEAARVVAPFVAAERPDLDVLTAAGVAEAARGRRSEALALFAKARDTDPSNAMVHVNIGTVHLLAGDLVAARAAFLEALELDANVARAHNSLGVIASREGREAEAVERWKRAAMLDPSDYQTLFNLGSTLRRQGREAEARPYLEAYLKAAPVALEARDIARVRGWLSAAPRP
jgi:arylsulfatase A-like enzyme/Flp pilus assembly protein TadD